MSKVEPLSDAELTELRSILCGGPWPARYGDKPRPHLARRLLATIEHRVEQERAACAAIAEEQPVSGGANWSCSCGAEIAENIRARSEAGAHRKEPA
jgi:hypothetical protein